MTQDFLVRQGTENDLPAALALIKELAVYEKMPNEVETTVQTMQRDGFGPQPLYGFFVAELDSQIVGLSLYYYRYSTWKGKRMYLEDLIVTQSKRGLGIGKALFERTIQKAKEEDCQGMSWQVLDWNEPAIQFYKRYAAKLEPGWLNCSLSGSQTDGFEAG